MRFKRTTMLLAVTAIIALWQAPGLAQDNASLADTKLPRIQVSETSFDFGRVTQGSSISHIFWIKNVGADTLYIRDIKPG